MCHFCLSLFQRPKQQVDDKGTWSYLLTESKMGTGLKAAQELGICPYN